MEEEPRPAESANCSPATLVAEATIKTAGRRHQGHLRARIERIPYLDPIDLRYRSRVKVPVPTSKAVMFCLM